MSFGKEGRFFAVAGVVLVAAVFFFSPRAEAVLKGEEFDSRKLEGLERVQEELVAEGIQSADARVAAAAQAGAQVVSEEDMKRPPEVVKEEFKVISRKKTLLERLTFTLQSDLNYDSNLFGERQGRRSDFYYRAGGGVELDVSDIYKDLGFVLNYGGTWEQYFSFARLNHYDQNINIDLPGYGKRFRIGRKLTVGASAGVALTGDDGVSTEDQGVFAQALQPFASIDADYILSRKFSTDFDYHFALRKVKNQVETATGREELSTNGEDQSIQDHSFAHRLKYHLTPKTFTFVGVGYGFSSSNNNDDGSDTLGNENSDSFGSKYFRLTGGVEGKLTSKSTVSLEAGWQRRTFTSGETSENSLYFQTAYLVQLTRKWSGRILALRDTQASLSETTGLYTTTGVNVGVTYRPTQQLTLTTDPYFRWNEVDNDPSTTTTPTGALSTNTINTADEQGDNWTYGVNTSIRYYVRRWFTVHLDYRFEMRKAQPASGNYVDHLATVGVDIGPLTKWRG